MEEGGNITRDNGGTKKGCRPFIQNANPIGNSGRSQEWRGCAMKLSNILHIFTGSSRKVRETLDQLERVREEQNNKLEVITKATLNGESEWFFKLAKEDPTCVLRVIKECGVKGKI
jgi:hypothetical protein